MRVLFNALSAYGPRSGVGHYTAELLRCLPGQAGGDEAVVARPGAWIGRLKWRMAGKAGSGSAAGAARSSWRSRVAALAKPRRAVGAYVRLQAKCGRFDLLHEPNFLPEPADIPAIATIHDLSVLLYPEWHPAERVRVFERQFARAVRESAHLITDAEAVRGEVIETLGVPASRVTSIPCGVRPHFRPLDSAIVAPLLRALGLSPGYLLYAGTIEPRKNLATLLRAYCDLPSEMRARAPLILAGGWGWNVEEIAGLYESEAKQKNVRCLGYVPEAALAALYNGARALVYPSLYEGFGLPPLEMLACGGAVLASTAATLAEVVGGQAELIAPEDIVGWREAMRRVIEDDDWHRELREGSVEHARPFTWERCAARTMEVYRHVAAGNFDCGPALPTRRAA